MFDFTKTRLIDYAKDNEVTEEDFLDAIDQWHEKTPGVQKISTFLGIPFSLMSAYYKDEVSFEDMIQKALYPEDLILKDTSESDKTAEIETRPIIKTNR